jgi:DNA-binding HxlR family transcriptional regulator
MKTPKKVVNVGVNALAREVGLTPATVSKKLKQGQTAAQIRREAAQRQGRAPEGRAPEGKLRASGRTPVGRPPQSEYDLVVKGRERMNALDEMKFRRAKALAERSELDNMLRRGELIPVAYVRQWASRYLTDGRDMLLTGPSELADTLAAESDPLKCAAILRAWLERVMGKFHQLEKLWGAGDEAQVA